VYFLDVGISCFADMGEFHLPIMEIRDDNQGFRPLRRRGLPDIDYPFHDRIIIVAHLQRRLPRPQKDQLQHRLRRSGSASKKFMTISGWSALWIMIWDTSIWRRARGGTAGKSLRPKSVTYVLGTFCHLVSGLDKKIWSRGADLNRRPADYESAALPTELPRHRLRM
jgi:hypothetical protein